MRCDSGVVTGSVVPEFYDSMIAKIIASGPTREAARTSLIAALRELVVLGIATNRDRLIQILESEALRSSRIHTTVLDEIGPMSAEAAIPAEDLALIVAALDAKAGPVNAPSIAQDPWGTAISWRLA